MKELRDILKAYATLKNAGETACLATVVDARGSTYRHPGARMLIRQGGESVGTISSGCLDQDLMERAAQVVTSGSPLVVTYDSTSPEDIVWGMNLGCGGVVRVLIEPLPRPGAFDHLEVLARWVEEGERGGMATLFGVNGRFTTPPGGRYLLRRDGWTGTDIRETALIDRLHTELSTLLSDGRTRMISCETPEGTADVFLELIRPPVSLVILGAGRDAIPLAEFAHALGWTVTVIDARAGFLQRDRFAGVDGMILADPDKVAEHFSFTGDEAAVVMTHNFNHDYELLKTLFASPVQYIGLLSSRGKTGELLKKLREEGFRLTEEQLARLYTPVGLDIGGETPEQIALAIVAEIQAVMAGRSGGFLRNRSAHADCGPKEA